MLFNSIEYLIFLPIVFALYWIMANHPKRQNILIVVASYIFYGWWDWRFLILIAFTSICSFVSGILIDKSPTPKKRSLLSAFNICINLTILGIFKYYNFFADSLVSAFSSIGVTLHPTTLHLILPVGISFYTFQALSYTIDVKRGKLEATRDIISFFAFISFFPQLVAGPIERATNLLPQFQTKRKFDYATAVNGTKQILWGLFKKMVIADNCADVVDKVWANPDAYSSPMLILGAILFTFQIYGDFSGYSDIAIGTGKLFGIRLMRNFNLPFFSRSVAEFWKRWHISLNTWFVDYVYIPLGGSREGRWKSIRNTFIIFTLSGLWHGANWTYVTWGLYHATLFIPLLLLGKNKKYRNTVAEGKKLPTLSETWNILLTFLLVVFGFIIFRAENMSVFFHYMGNMLTNWHQPFLISGKNILVYVLILILVEWLNRTKEHAFAFHLKNPYLRWGIYMATALCCLTLAGKQVQFIYFQF